jgi:hypothetical protein
MGWAISECLIGDPWSGGRGNAYGLSRPSVFRLSLEGLPFTRRRHRTFSSSFGAILPAVCSFSDTPSSIPTEVLE